MLVKRARLALGFVAGFIVAFLILKGAHIVHDRIVDRRIHSTTFSVQQDRALLIRTPHRSLSGQTLAHGAMFRDAVDLVISENWVLVLGTNNRLTGLNLIDGNIRDFSAILASTTNQTSYPFMWSGQEDEVFVGNTDQVFAQISTEPDGTPVGILPLTRPKSMTYSLPVSGGVWLSSGFFWDGVTTLVTGRREGNHLVSVKDIKRPIFPGLSPSVFWEANRNSIAARPDGERLAEAFWYAPYIYIFDNTGNFLRSTLTPVDVNQAFSEGIANGEVRMRHISGTIRCYIAATASRLNIIGLFSGKSRHKIGYAIEANELHVFNWDGQLVEIDRLDSFVSKIEVSPDGNVIYASRVGNDPGIVEYKLH